MRFVWNKTKHFLEFKWHFLKKSGIILVFFGFMLAFLVALNASFTSIIEKGLSVALCLGEIYAWSYTEHAPHDGIMVGYFAWHFVFVYSLQFWLCRDFLLGGEKLKRAFFFSLLQEFFLTAELDSLDLVLKPGIFLN